MSRKDPLKAAYVIWGEDRATVERAVHALGARVVSEGGLPPERLRAEETPAEAVVAACEALSFAGLRLVVVEEADRWKAADATPLLHYLASPNEGACLALVARDAVTPKLEAAVAALGEKTVLRYGPDPKATRAERAKWLADHLRKETERAGGSMPAAVARQVIERVVVDRPGARKEGVIALELTQEARKLAAYAAGEPITAEMVQLLVSRHPDARVYELSDAICSGQAAQSYDILQDMATGDEPVAPIVIQVQLANHFRRVATVQALGGRPSPDEIGSATGVKGFPARKLGDHAEALPPAAAEPMVARLAALELDLRVSSLLDLGAARAEGARADGARLVLELAVRDLLAMARGGQPAPGHGA
ncbi:MAG: DNA polymerase III subunit delta [Thermoleophilia bacterium]